MSGLEEFTGKESKGDDAAWSLLKQRPGQSTDVYALLLRLLRFEINY